MHHAPETQEWLRRNSTFSLMRNWTGLTLSTLAWSQEDQGGARTICNFSRSGMLLSASHESQCTCKSRSKRQLGDMQHEVSNECMRQGGLAGRNEPPACLVDAEQYLPTQSVSIQQVVQPASSGYPAHAPMYAPEVPKTQQRPVSTRLEPLLPSADHSCQPS
jgi:hypothetical protein